MEEVREVPIDESSPAERPNENQQAVFGLLEEMADSEESLELTKQVLEALAPEGGQVERYARNQLDDRIVSKIVGVEHGAQVVSSLFDSEPPPTELPAQAKAVHAFLKKATETPASVVESLGYVNAYKQAKNANAPLPEYQDITALSECIYHALDINISYTGSGWDDDIKEELGVLG